MGAIAIETVCPSRDVADTITATCLMEGLVATVDITPGGDSLTVQEGRVVKTSSFRVLMKTAAGRQGEAISAIFHLHPELETQTISYPIGVTASTAAWIANKCGGITTPTVSAVQKSLAH